MRRLCDSYERLNSQTNNEFVIFFRDVNCNEKKSESQDFPMKCHVFPSNRVPYKPRIKWWNKKRAGIPKMWSKTCLDRCFHGTLEVCELSATCHLIHLLRIETLSGLVGIPRRKFSIRDFKKAFKIF